MATPEEIVKMIRTKAIEDFVARMRRIAKLDISDFKEAGQTETQLALQELDRAYKEAGC